LPQALHATWSGGMMHLWAEDAALFASASQASVEARAGALVGAAAGGDAGGGVVAIPRATGPHPFASNTFELASLPSGLREAIMNAPAALVRLTLPARTGLPVASPTLELAGALAGSRMRDALMNQDGDAEPDVDFEDPTIALAVQPVEEALDDAPPADVSPVSLASFDVPTRTLEPGQALELLPLLADALAEQADTDGPGTDDDATVRASGDLEYWALAARFARFILAQQRFVPMLVQVVTGELRGAWRPWLSDEALAKRATLLVSAMPTIARSPEDAHDHDAWAITEDCIASMVDAACRRVLIADSFGDALDNQDPAKDPHVALLSGLLQSAADIQGPLAIRQDLVKRVRTWISGLEERGVSAAWRLLVRLNEPDVAGLAPDAAPDPNKEAWTLSFHLQSVDSTSLIVDGSDIWLLKGDSATIMGRRMDQPQELLLKELGRAARFYRRLEIALQDSEPEAIKLSTRQAYEFLREVRPILIEQGFGAEAPAWWDSPAARVGAKLKLESQEGFDPRLAGGQTNAAKPQLGLATLVNYKWEISVGDMTISLEEFEKLAAKRTPLVRVNGRWVEIRPEDVHAAIKFIRDNPGGQIRLSEAMRLAYSMDVAQTGVPVVGLEATGWLAGFMNSEAATKQLEMLPPPKLFRGTLRPYQSRGVSWMMFQERLGFGICLADDMGLGKTVQLLALLAYEREGQDESAEAAKLRSDEVIAANSEGKQASSLSVLPTLLLVPMSVVGNWLHETRRFCPHLRVLVHHGPTRKTGDAFLDVAGETDLVITTYALAHRDRETLARVKWGRVVLDEAQYIKNPTSKQAQAARLFEADHRIALTGTPVENRLAELWSIMDFLNPGYLGGASSFRTRFSLAIERYHDKAKGEQLRSLIRPFILRRLKSDPTVVADLPAKLESKEFSHLTSEQAAQYESCVKRMLSEVDAAEGIQRRGLVLSALIKLKQICNHPGQANKDWETGAAGGKAPDPTRSGKCIRLLEMLDEIIAEGDHCLLFTQFRQMGHMLDLMIRHKFGKEVLFIHGGTPMAKRQQMIDTFQKGDGSHPVMLLSLRAGGVGLNLTAATHVFHFDRWWNPAVENQATDRAYRIGQTRTVQVHKFVVRGTLEERIDQMIESKTELAENIIGQGEQWLSELSTDQLRDILTLRNDAIDDVD
jgi:SNF2 family DNA or RNA helicase